MNAAEQVKLLLDQQIDACKQFSARGNPTPLIIGPGSAAAIETLARALAALTTDQETAHS